MCLIIKITDYLCIVYYKGIYLKKLENKLSHFLNSYFKSLTFFTHILNGCFFFNNSEMISLFFFCLLII